MRTALVLVTVLNLGQYAISTAAEGPSAPAPPDPTTYDLRYKLATGDVLRYATSHRASIRSTLDQTTQAAQTKTESIKAWKVTDALPSGDIEIMNVVEYVHMVNQLPDRDPTEYDSRRDKVPPPGYEDAARSIGVPLSVMRIKPSGEVVRRDVKVQQQSVEEDAPIVVRLPDKPVAVGETWDTPFDVTVMLEGGGTKSVQTRRHHKLKSASSGIATIEVTYQVLSPISAHIESQLVQRLIEGEVKFDIEAGRVVSQQMDIDKRILGFAGPTSSMHYVVRMDERLMNESPEATARRVPDVSTRPATRTTPPRNTRSYRSSKRTRTPQGARGYRR